jgi:hypothetical protein
MDNNSVAADNISKARLRLSAVPGLHVSPHYERVQPFEHNDPIQHCQKPSEDGDLSPLSTGLEAQGRRRTRPNTYWLGNALWRQVWHDVRLFPWRKIGRQSMIGLVPPLVFLGILALLVLMSVSPGLFIAADQKGCSPNGNFGVRIPVPLQGGSVTYSGAYRTKTYSPWTRASIYSIDVKFGRYSFATAKLIDVAWDTVCQYDDEPFTATD